MNITFTIWIRSILFYTYYLISTLIFGTLISGLFFLPFRFLYFLARYWCKGVITALQKICHIDYELVGTQNIPNSPVIVMSQHQSTWETIFFLAYFKLPVSFVLKRELLLLPFFGWSLFFMRGIPINRKNRNQALSSLLYYGTLRLKQGHNVLIFPEGTRTPYGKDVAFKSGGARLAIATNYPILPISLNTGLFWPKSVFLKPPGKITVVFHPPMLANDFSTPVLTEKIKEVMRKHPV